jgi:hypothetical protein
MVRSMLDIAKSQNAPARVFANSLKILQDFGSRDKLV